MQEILQKPPSGAQSGLLPEVEMRARGSNPIPLCRSRQSLNGEVPHAAREVLPLQVFHRLQESSLD